MIEQGLSTPLALKLLFYAINGTGLGHITRLNNVATDAAWLCQQVGIQPRFEFLTTSDAPAVVRDFPVTKLPSRTTVKALGLPVKATTAKIKAQIISMINGMNADALILDTNPKGAYSEFSFIRGLARKTIFIDRARKRASIDSATQQHIALYDQVLCPEASVQQASDLFHPNLQFIGKIHGFKPEVALSYQEVRQYFGAKPGQPLVYLSSGGGGDPLSEQALKQWLTAIRATEPHALVVVGYGPLYRGEMMYADRQVIPYTGTDINHYFAGFDYAVSAAGYNSFEELKAAQIPTLFYPLAKGFDDQAARIAAAASEHLCVLADLEHPHQGLQQLHNHKLRIAENLAQQPLAIGSLKAALHIVNTALQRKRHAPDWQQLSTAVEQRIAERNQRVQQLRLARTVA